MVDRRPRAIVRCASADDVADAIRYGRERDLEIGVRCGGHSVLGLGVPGRRADDRPHPDGRRARRSGPPSRPGAGRGAARRARPRRDGTRAGHDRRKRLPHRRRRADARRRDGLAGARARAVVRQRRLIRADHGRRRPDPRRRGVEPELFFGLRGGGGNFGIVSEFEFRLHPVSRRAHVVELFFPVEDAAPVLRGWRDLRDRAARGDLHRVGRRIAVAVRPRRERDRPLANVGFVWAGEPELDPSLLPALRALGRPVAERVEELSYLELQRMDDAHTPAWRAPLLEGPLLLLAAGRGDRRVPAARHARRIRRAAARRDPSGLRRRDRSGAGRRQRVQPP